jgi:dimeric dUTPase (all-alpha-NTP-PPase superfamily)
MNLEKLFQTQKVLRDRIGYNEPDRFNKLILALKVELGECANEWRGFKFWSVNQIPHTSAVRVPTMMEEDKEYYNPLLEEYVDGYTSFWN